MYFDGSGFIIDPSGIIVTNRHVIAGAYEITVILPGLAGDCPATPLYISGVLDLALLKVDAGQPAAGAEARRQRQGARRRPRCMLLGNPLGVGLSVSHGVVSALNRDIGESRTTISSRPTRALNHGNSGGADGQPAGRGDRHQHGADQFAGQYRLGRHRLHHADQRREIRHRPVPAHRPRGRRHRRRAGAAHQRRPRRGVRPGPGARPDRHGGRSGRAGRRAHRGRRRGVARERARRLGCGRDGAAGGGDAAGPVARRAAAAPRGRTGRDRAGGGGVRSIPRGRWTCSAIRRATPRRSQHPPTPACGSAISPRRRGGAWG